MAAAAILDFQKMSITPTGQNYLHQIWWADASCHAEITHDQKSKPEINLRDVIK